jgi:hypothetical protein
LLAHCRYSQGKHANHPQNHDHKEDNLKSKARTFAANVYALEGNLYKFSKASVSLSVEHEFSKYNSNPHELHHPPTSLVLVGIESKHLPFLLTMDHS